MKYIYMPKGLQGLKLDNTNIKDWITDRALPITRKNADKIYQAMTLPRENSEIALMFLTHSLSINDNYWIIKSIRRATGAPNSIIVLIKQCIY